MESRKSWFRYRYIVWTIMVLCWLLEALSYRHSVYPDGIAYLEIASACAKGNWHSLINGYWSPAYPALFSFVLSVFKPSVVWELALLHCFNCLVLVGSLASFEYFLNALIHYLSITKRAIDQEWKPLPAWVFRAIGYALFFWDSVYATPPSVETPDVLVLALVLLAVGILLRIASGRDSWQYYAALGVVLGLAYLTKAAMFPLSFVFLAVVPFATGNLRRGASRALLAFALFLLIASPFALTLSKIKGRLTFGDSGRINYAEYVNSVRPIAHWQGGPPGSGIPLHPTRKILDTPSVYEFATPLGGSYPPWTDQSYWYEGVRPHFELGGQLKVLRHSLATYFGISMQISSLSVIPLIVLFCFDRFGNVARSFSRLFFLWIPALSALGLYSLILVEPRYVTPFILLLWAATYSALRVPQSDISKVIVRASAFVVVLLLGFQSIWAVGLAAAHLTLHRDFPAWTVAKELHHARIQPGERVAAIGDTISDHHWAHLAGVTIVAQVPAESVSTFLASGPERRMETMGLLARSGAKAVVANDLPPLLLQEGWQEIADTKYFIFVYRN
ncbi:MAG TPA: glycosyltransferase family 39 protein [Terriglobales bacterium]|nr:glycosyltransferase family 39 protein [Terriglobales bacterium]